MFYYKNTQNTLCKYQNGKACDRDSCLISCISLLQENPKSQLELWHLQKTISQFLLWLDAAM